MKLKLTILDGAGARRAEASGEDLVNLCWGEAYQQGDGICLETDAPGSFLVVRLEDSMPPTLVYLAGPRFLLPVPFGEKRVSYSPKSFVGGCHLLSARAAQPGEITAYRNLAFNPFDCHENTSLYPHAGANVETRGEAVFAARNAIDGNTASGGHGCWPYESWGINQQEDAELTLWFGRAVRVDKAVVTLRADFPHDNWWQQATLLFSDGSFETLRFSKTGMPQALPFAPRTVTWAKLFELKKCPQDPSPFPALTQLELWGGEA